MSQGLKRGNGWIANPIAQSITPVPFPTPKAHSRPFIVESKDVPLQIDASNSSRRIRNEDNRRRRHQGRKPA